MIISGSGTRKAILLLPIFLGIHLIQESRPGLEVLHFPSPLKSLGIQVFPNEEGEETRERISNSLQVIANVVIQLI